MGKLVNQLSTILEALAKNQLRAQSYEVIVEICSVFHHSVMARTSIDRIRRVFAEDKDAKVIVAAPSRLMRLPTDAESPLLDLSRFYCVDDDRTIIPFKDKFKGDYAATAWATSLCQSFYTARSGPSRILRIDSAVSKGEHIFCDALLELFKVMFESANDIFVGARTSPTTPPSSASALSSNSSTSSHGPAASAPALASASAPPLARKRPTSGSAVPGRKPPASARDLLKPLSEGQDLLSHLASPTPLVDIPTQCDDDEGGDDNEEDDDEDNEPSNFAKLRASLEQFLKEHLGFEEYQRLLANVPDSVRQQLALIIATVAPVKGDHDIHVLALYGEEGTSWQPNDGVRPLVARLKAIKEGSIVIFQSLDRITRDGIEDIQAVVRVRNIRLVYLYPEVEHVAKILKSAGNNAASAASLYLQKSGILDLVAPQRRKDVAAAPKNYARQVFQHAIERGARALLNIPLPFNFLCLTLDGNLQLPAIHSAFRHFHEIDRSTLAGRLTPDFATLREHVRSCFAEVTSREMHQPDVEREIVQLFERAVKSLTGM